MKFSFDTRSRLILIPVDLTGPWGSDRFWFALDTAASRTCISEVVLRSIGIDTDQYPRSRRVHGVGADERFGEVPLVRIQALGVIWQKPTVAFMKLNPKSNIHGLLGLDFFRGRILTVDFARGTIALRRPWRWPLAR